MLPLILVLILLMRMDGMLMAFRLEQQQQSQTQQLLQQSSQLQSYLEDYDSNSLLGDTIQDIINEQLMLPLESRYLTEAERIRRCMNFKYGSKEMMDMEERDIMKDARTSFLPQDSTAMPRECLEALNFDFGRSPEDYDKVVQNLRRRVRHTTADNYNFYETNNATLDELAESSSTIEAAALPKSTDEFADAFNTEDIAGFIETSSALQSFWNAQGNKESIRSAQAKTMKRYMDTSVDPCDDFYKYSCGNWEKLHPIPKDKAGFDTFEMLRENLDIVLKQLLESGDIDERNTLKSKVAVLADNNYVHKTNADADIVSTADTQQKPVAVSADLPPKDAIKTEQEPFNEMSAELRQHIVQRRDVLSRLLMRRKRQTTNTKRKRLYVPNTGTAALNSNLASSQYAPKNAKQKARYLYQSCTNSQLLAKRGIQPLLKLINDLGGWPVLDPHWHGEHFDWLDVIAQLRRYNNDILIVEWVGPDIKNSDENIIQFDQTSLGLPTREYFLQEVNAKYLQAYQSFMTDIMHKLGAPEDIAAHTASELIAFETQLASITSPAEQRLNVTKLYKRMTLQHLQSIVPEIDWLRYLSILQERNVQDSEEIVIYAIDYMQELVSLLAVTEPRVIANYLMWRFVRHRINNVDDRFEDSKQNFYHTLFGREASPSRWKVCIAQVNTNMGMALGAMFVKKYFDENSKKDTMQMTHELQQAFREILKTTDWIDPSTKHLAELKVNAMSLKIGYPDFILNTAELDEKYAGIDIHPDKYFENTLNVLLHTAKIEQAKLHETVNKTAWQTAPAIVNAYYSRNKNQIMFPAGILQPPFYHRHFPRSLNFGGIGVVIGHELTHGFDDKGRLFDRNGSIHKWWTDTSIQGFDERARCIISQYGNYTVGEVGIALNGESTQGENIADNGGIRQAFYAYKQWLQENPTAAVDERLPGIDMTGEQLFFLNFGQVWCGAMRPEAVRNKLNTAIHSPGRFRVIGTVSNSQDFAREFNCPLGSPMNPVHKCAVW